MTLVDMDSVQFWQPPPATCPPGNGRPTAALRPRYKPSRPPQKNDSIEIIDMTALPLRECSNPLRDPVPDLTDVEANAEGKAYRQHAL